MPPFAPGTHVVRPGESLSAAVDAAAEGGEILFADGVYTGTGDELLSINNNKSVTLRALHPGGGAVLDGEDARRIIKMTDAAHVTIVGLALTRGAAMEGGILHAGRASRLVMSNCTITDATATAVAGVGHARGGVLYLDEGASADLTDVVVANAAAASDSIGRLNSAQGGVIFLGEDANATLTNCHVANVTAVSLHSSAAGGSVYVSAGGSATLIATDITNSSARSENANAYSGTIHAAGHSTLTLVSCTIFDSSIVSGQTVYGGVFTISGIRGVATIIGSTITNVWAESTDGTSTSTYVDGGVFAAYSGCTATFDGCVISGVTARSNQSTIYGALASLWSLPVKVTMTNTAISDVTVISTPAAQGSNWAGVLGGLVWSGGGVQYGDSRWGQFNNLTMVNVTVANINITTTEQVLGGILFSQDVSVFEFTGCTISNVLVATTAAGIVNGTAPTNTVTGVHGGVAHLRVNTSVMTLTGCAITDVTAASHAVRGGALSLTSGASATLVDTRIERCVARLSARVSAPGAPPNDFWPAEGGAAYAREGSRLTLTRGTVLLGNAAASQGHTLMVEGATVMYILTTPPGRWVHGTPCIVNRLPCGSGDGACKLVQAACSVLPVATGAAVGGVACPALYPNFQSCDWYASPGLVGQTVDTLPQGPLDVDYPYAREAHTRRAIAHATARVHLSLQGSHAVPSHLPLRACTLLTVTRTCTVRVLQVRLRPRSPRLTPI